MRIQYMSDLHLEFKDHRPPVLHPIAPILVLAGDIGNPTHPVYRDFLRNCAGRWEHVVVVAGNHEFYNNHPVSQWRTRAPHTVADRLAACRVAATAAGANVHFLERQSVVLGDLAFLGCTLWSDVTRVEERGMSDYHVICAEGPARRVRAEDVKAWHARDRAWLTAELAACREEGRGAVVVTHHLPTYDLIASRYQGHPLNAGFASALDDLLCEPVRAWICGHSHVGGIVFKGPTGRIPCALNPRGYPRETETGFCGELFLDVVAGAGPGEDERCPELVSSATSRPDESASAPSLQTPLEPSQSSVAAGTLPDADSE